MRGIAAGVVVFVVATTARSDASPGANQLSMQAGMLPGVSFVGAEYARVLHPNIDIAAAVSYGFTGDASIVPRVRVPFSHFAVSFGAGPSLAYDKGFFGDEGSHWYGQALADFELTVITRDAWLLQLRGGVTVKPDKAMTTTPFLGLGLGRAL